MSWFGKSKKQQEEEAEWIANLPEEVEDDPRLGLPATCLDGFTGVIDSIYRDKDGTESFNIHDDRTGKGQGGLDADQITIHKRG